MACTGARKGAALLKLGDEWIETAVVDPGVIYAAYITEIQHLAIKARQSWRNIQLIPAPYTVELVLSIPQPSEG